MQNGNNNKHKMRPSDFKWLFGIKCIRVNMFHTKSGNSVYLFINQDEVYNYQMLMFHESFLPRLLLNQIAHVEWQVAWPEAK